MCATLRGLPIFSHDALENILHNAFFFFVVLSTAAFNGMSRRIEAFYGIKLPYSARR